MAVLADELSGFDLDVVQRLPPAFLESEILLPALVHGDAARRFPGQDLQAAHAVADLVVDAHPVVILEPPLAGIVRVHVDDRPATLEPQHGTMVAPRRVNRPAPV